MTCSHYLPRLAIHLVAVAVLCGWGQGLIAEETVLPWNSVKNELTPANGRYGDTSSILVKDKSWPTSSNVTLVVPSGQTVTLEPNVVVEGGKLEIHLDAVKNASMADPNDDILVGAYYMPGWKFDENLDWAHGNGFKSPWTNDTWITGAKYTNRDPKLGRTCSIALMEKECQAAASHGVNFFAINWYYNDPLNLNNGAHYFYYAKKHGMKYVLNYENSGPFDAQNDNEWLDACNKMATYICDDDYLQVNGKRMFIIYNWDAFLEHCSGDQNKAKWRIDHLRSVIRNYQCGELWVGTANTSDNPVNQGHSMIYAGVDFSTHYGNLFPSDLARPSDYAESTYPYYDYTKYGNYIEHKRWDHLNDALPHVPYVSLTWSPQAWTWNANGTWNRAGHNHPLYTMPDGDLSSWNFLVSQWFSVRDYVNNYAKYRLGGRKVFLINCWNEYGEGGIMAPTVGNGYHRLESLRQALKPWYVPYREERIRLRAVISVCSTRSSPAG